MATNNQQTLEPQDLKSLITQKTQDKIANTYAQHAANRVQQGEHPDQVMGHLMQTLQPQQQALSPDFLKQMQQVAQMRVPGGTDAPINGILPALFDAVSGKGFHPFQRASSPLGMQGAMNLLNTQNQYQMMPYKQMQTQTNTLQSLVNFAKATGNRQLLNSLASQFGGGQPGQAQVAQPEDQSGGQAATPDQSQSGGAPQDQGQQANMPQPGLDVSAPIDPLTGKPTLSGEILQKKAASLGPEQFKADKNLNTVLESIDNYVGALKGAWVQQGGHGPVWGQVGDVIKHFPGEGSGNIRALANTERNVAIQQASMYGSRAMATLFQHILGTLPNHHSTDEQAGTTLAEEAVMLYGIKRAVDRLGLKAGEMQKMDPGVLKGYAQAEIQGIPPEDRQALYNHIYDHFNQVPATQVGGLMTKGRAPSTHPLVKNLLGWAHPMSGLQPNEGKTKTGMKYRIIQ